MANKIQLPNGCTMGQPSVTPSNWKNGGKSLLERDWQIQYYFYDPNYHKKKPYGKLVPVKGMNTFKTLKERREVTAALIEDEIEKNLNGYNHFTKRFEEIRDFDDQEIHPDLPFIVALKLAHREMVCSTSYHDNIFRAINDIRKVAIKLRIHNTTIYDLKRRQVKLLLEGCKLTPDRFNKFRSYLSTLFKILLEYEVCEYNHIRDIQKKKVVKSKRKVMNPEELRIVLSHLKVKTYSFWRYAMIFLYSGSRTTEMLSLMKKDVDIEKREYTVTIKKGRQHKMVTKVIMHDVVHLWKELLENADEDDFLFSVGLVPGPNEILNSQITRRWSRHVKKSDEITDDKGNVMRIEADFYALKHAMLDSLPTEVARKMAAHTSVSTTGIYQVTKDKQEREELKRLEIGFFKPLKVV